VLKLLTLCNLHQLVLQPPSGGCVLKRLLKWVCVGRLKQPPSGGCVLKQKYNLCQCLDNDAAAFGRLCVETFVVRFVDW